MSAPDLSNAEMLDFHAVSGGQPTVRLKLSDGALIEVKVGILEVWRSGTDPATGYPSYVIKSQLFNRLIDVPKALRRPVTVEKRGGTGFA